MTGIASRQHHRHTRRRPLSLTWRTLCWLGLCATNLPGLASAQTPLPVAADVLSLGTFDLQNISGMDSKGPVVRQIENVKVWIGCALADQQHQLNIVYGPLAKTQRQLKTGEIDGYLYALPSAERDRSMTRLVPLFNTEIRLFWLRAHALTPLSPEFQQQGRITYLKGGAYTPEKYGLEGNIIELAATPRELIGLLLRGRVDAVLGASSGFKGMLDSMGVAYDSQLLDAMPFYLTVSNRFLVTRPEFVSRFVPAFEACRQAGRNELSSRG